MKFGDKEHCKWMKQHRTTFNIYTVDQEAIDNMCQFDEEDMGRHYIIVQGSIQFVAREEGQTHYEI